MSVETYFLFSAGLSGPLTVPVGTKAAIREHVEKTEAALGLRRSKHEDSPTHWTYPAGFSDIDGKVLCEAVERHNAWVRTLHAKLGDWAKSPPEPGETMTPEDAAEFWHALELLIVPPDRWTETYYRARMDALYEAMRGRDGEGVIFDAKALTAKQAGAVIGLIEQYLDPADLQLEVPDGCDYLASCYWGECEWCGECGKAKLPEDGATCRRRKCPLTEKD